METVYNKFKKWLDEKGISPLAFSRMSKVNHLTIYKVYNGGKLEKKPAARKISRYTHGEVTLQDLGVE